MSKPDFLSRAYTLGSVDETRKLYDDWAADYEAELTRQGYATPLRMASTLKEYLRDRAAPVLDFGCGTGLSGAALSKAGFRTIDGCDLSEEMLSHARARGIYRNLWTSKAGARLPGRTGTYDAIVACGAISKGAAPASALGRLVQALAPGGLLLLSYNDHTLADPEYTGEIDRLIGDRDIAPLRQEMGAHLPGLGLRAMIYVFERQ
ncbi:class I SAM-dependent methyltransferase [Mesobaculum littorinae]|uniref:Class I SAM-dependent methyltransferase n=1 Tax=Mesobaculum littorinae TaxID=2486419 RepID=A0A438AL43_9RHOB|nr:class I SAM-dependent methyltransferase [Mesobaculum littorinae]RVV99551.1 class I SAM-dependent methyltransferase [Mesobaculum littorinae]